MKKYVILIALLVLIVERNYAIEINGTIKMSNDAILTNVSLFIPLERFSKDINFTKFQRRIEYRNSEGMKIRLKPNQIKELKFSYLTENYVFEYIKLTTHTPFKSHKKLLLRKKIDGEISYYQYYKKEPSGPMGRVIIYFEAVLKLANGENIVPCWFNNFKSICGYLEGCPSLVDKILNGQYKKKDVPTIVNEYNNCN